MSAAARFSRMRAGLVVPGMGTRYGRLLRIHARQSCVQVHSCFCEYCTWAAIDLYSTREGFGKRYGFVYIDADPDFKRIKKDSFAWYRKVIATNGEDLTD